MSLFEGLAFLIGFLLAGSWALWAVLVHDSRSCCCGVFPLVGVDVVHDGETHMVHSMDHCQPCREFL